MRVSARPPLARIAAIDRAIRRGGWPNVRTLAQELEVSHRTVQRELTRRRVAPYHLTQIESDWYLIAHCHLRQEVRIFATVRIRAARKTGETFTRPAGFDAAAYLASGFRAVPGPPRHRVTLRFTPSAAVRVGEKLWHHTQTSETLEDGAVLLHMHLSDLREVCRWILWCGREVEVVEPAELRDMIRSEVEGMERMYSAALPGS